MTQRIRSQVSVFAIAVLFVCRAGAQVAVSEIVVAAEPADGAIRPLETALLQARIYGMVTGAAGAAERVRLQPGGVEFHVVEKGGGWLSAPFAHQEAPGMQRMYARKSALPSLNGSMPDPGALPMYRDSVVYTAPERPGLYHIRASLEGKDTIVELRVAADAPSNRRLEAVSFPPEPRPADPRRRIAEHYAPFVAQATWFEPKADFLARFDFDGNWRGDDNWAATPAGSSQAYVYYAVIETATHWFLIYNFFHPRDYAERCFIATCHENDNEGLILTVRKDGSEFGDLQVMETLAHNRVYSYRADSRIQGGVHKIAAGVEFYEQSHPAVFVEAGGHGVFGSLDSHSEFTLQSGDFRSGTGVTYVYRGEARRPAHASDRAVAYDLIPIYEHWWLRAADPTRRDEGAFDDPCSYLPLGGRPGMSRSEVLCSFLGRAMSRNRAKPFWGWLDWSARSVVAVGQWGLDPAYAVSQTLRFPEGEPFSLEYVWNPFLLPARSH